MSSDRFGAKLMKKQGWDAGQGLGREQQGAVDHVKVSKKDDVKGLGYNAQVAQTWSQQSVGFADVLSRIKSSSPTPAQDDESAPSSPTASGAPSAGKHAQAYLKRRRLKTEGLTSSDGKGEILGEAMKKRGRDDDDDSDAEAERQRKADKASTLDSALLNRLMVRVLDMEPKATQEGASLITITKPEPRPPRCTEAPFFA